MLHRNLQNFYNQYFFFTIFENLPHRLPGIHISTLPIVSLIYWGIKLFRTILSNQNWWAKNGGKDWQHEIDLSGRTEVFGVVR